MHKGIEESGVGCVSAWGDPPKEGEGNEGYDGMGGRGPAWTVPDH